MLNGRKIGLSHYMSVEEMKQHLEKVREEWVAEGYADAEVKEAIFSKCKPLGLVSNFYWSRYPDAADRLRQAWDLLHWTVAEQVKKHRVTKAKPRTQQKVVHNFLEQF